MSRQKTPFQPKAADEACVMPCRHPQCRALRRTWHLPCSRCGGPIYFSASGYVLDPGDGPIHLACLTRQELAGYLLTPRGPR